MFLSASNRTYDEAVQNFQSNEIHDFKPIDLKLRDPLYIVVPLTVWYLFILIAGIIGNVINCWVIIKIKSMHTTTNYYLFSLSVSDLLLLTSSLPQEIYLTWYRYPYVFGETFCVLRGVMAEMSANATVLTITAFSVERYIAICHPFLAYLSSDLSRTTKLILAIWCIALVFAIPQALQFGLVMDKNPDTLQCTLKRILVPHSFALSALFFFIIPMVIISILYAMIGIKMKSSNEKSYTMRRRSLRNFSTSSANTSRSSMFNQRASKTPQKMLVAVVATFFTCWAPFHLQRLVAVYGMSSEDTEFNLLHRIYDTVTYISAILYYTSSMMNPVVYQISCHKFREGFKEAFGTLHTKAPTNEGSS